MNDITKHEWNDTRVKVIEAGFNFVTITTTSHSKLIDISKDDSIAIAKHFYDNASAHERIELINSIRGVEKLTITSGIMEVGNTYPSLDLTPEEAINHKWVNVNPTLIKAHD